MKKKAEHDGGPNRLLGHTALLVIDVQKGFDEPRWGRRNNPHAEANIARLLAAWRKRKAPVIFVQHDSTVPGSPLAPGGPGWAIKEEVSPLPGEAVVHKQVHSAFIGTQLELLLRRREIQGLVLAGLTTDHCVSTTARMAANLGFSTFVIADATACFERLGHDSTRYAAEEVHRVSLASLHGEFVTVLDTEQALSLLGASEAESGEADA